jgi:hypothetical protein
VVESVAREIGTIVGHMNGAMALSVLWLSHQVCDAKNEIVWLLDTTLPREEQWPHERLSGTCEQNVVELGFLLIPRMLDLAMRLSNEAPTHQRAIIETGGAPTRTANVHFVDDYPRYIVGDATYVLSLTGEPTAGIWLPHHDGRGSPPQYYAAFFGAWGNTLVARFDHDFTGKSAWAIGVSMESRTVANIDELLSERGLSFTWTGNLRGAAGPSRRSADNGPSKAVGLGVAIAILFALDNHRINASFRALFGALARYVCAGHSAGRSLRSLILDTVSRILLEGCAKLPEQAQAARPH